MKLLTTLIEYLTVLLEHINHFYYIYQAFKKDGNKSWMYPAPPLHGYANGTKNQTMIL